MTQSGRSADPPVQVLLRRVDPSRNCARYYVLSIEPTLFEEVTLARRWGRIGGKARERVEAFDDEAGARASLEAWLARKSRRAYEQA